MSEAAGHWVADSIRALRLRLGESQQAFADRLGTRQQTVSEWERGQSHPRRMAQRLLGLVAESAAEYGPPADPGGPGTVLSNLLDDATERSG